jgi:hypothetical protein
LRDTEVLPGQGVAGLYSVQELFQQLSAGCQGFMIGLISGVGYQPFYGRTICWREYASPGSISWYRDHGALLCQETGEIFDFSHDDVFDPHRAVATNLRSRATRCISLLPGTAALGTVYISTSPAPKFKAWPVAVS